MKNTVTIEEKLITDLKNYGSSICVSLATQVRDEMFETAKGAIDDFYEHYPNPIKYNRNKYNFKKKSFIKYYKNPHNTIVRGGIELTPDKIDNIYGVDPTYVFDLVYSGHHGNVEAFPHSIYNIPPVMSPSPMEILEDKKQYIIDHIGNYKNIALQNARRGNYSTFCVKL